MLPFVPRKVAKALQSKQNAASGHPATPQPSVQAHALTGNRPSTASTTLEARHAEPSTSQEHRAVNPERKWKGKARDDGTSAILSEDTCLVLLCLTTSAHAFGLDSEMRWRVESSDDGCEYCSLYRRMYLITAA